MLRNIPQTLPTRVEITPTIPETPRLDTSTLTPKIREAFTSRLYTLIGQLEASFLSKVGPYVLQINQPFLQGVPTQSEINNIKNKVNTLRSFKNNYQARIQSLTGNRISDPLLRSSVTLQTIITLLKNLPIPGISTTAGLVVTFSDKVREVTELSKDLEQSARSIVVLANSINTALQTVGISEQQFAKIDIAIELSEVFNVVNSEISEQDKSFINQNIYNVINQDERGSNLAATEIRKRLQIKTLAQQQTLAEQNVQELIEQTLELTDGNSITLKIIEVPSEYTKAILRQAVGFDQRGIAVVYGNKSFASNPQVLIEELRLKILLNNQ
jgi:hypothetical protein